MKMFKTYLILILLICCTQSIVAQYRQHAILYQQRHSGGKFMKVPDVYVPDLTAYDFQDKAHSVCFTGIWVFYERKEYNKGGHIGAEWFFGADNRCLDLETIGGRVSSLKFVGSPDYRSNTFTLFEENDFGGSEEYTYLDLTKLNYLEHHHKSIIITGDVGWTVYDLPNFEGNYICLHPKESKEYAPLFIPDLKTQDIPYGTIKSLRKGCEMQNSPIVGVFGRKL